jgi:hypothetical protein
LDFFFVHIVYITISCLPSQVKARSFRQKPARREGTQGLPLGGLLVFEAECFTKSGGEGFGLIKLGISLWLGIAFLGLYDACG